MTTGAESDCPSTKNVLIRTMDEYLALKHGTGTASMALGALFRDRYGDDCSVSVCDRSADLVFIILNSPTVVLPFCEGHAHQMCGRYANLADHLPELTPEATAPFLGSGVRGSLRTHLTRDDDNRELRDYDERAGSQNDAHRRSQAHRASPDERE